MFLIKAEWTTTGLKSLCTSQNDLDSVTNILTFHWLYFTIMVDDRTEAESTQCELGKGVNYIHA